MIKSHLRLAFATGICVLSTAALAADYAPPAPPEDLRPSDWTGPYVGGFVGGTFVEGHYNVCGCSDPEMSGAGWHGGVLGGFNYDFGGVVVGIEGDYAWGDQTAQNRDPAEATELTFDNVATIRARLGWADGATLIYGTGGFGWIDASMDALVGPDSVHDSDGTTFNGWVVGGGVEHAFGDYIHGRLEYLYGDFGNENFTLTDHNGNGGTVDLNLDNTHFVRAGLTVNFGWF